MRALVAQAEDLNSEVYRAVNYVWRVSTQSVAIFLILCDVMKKIIQFTFTNFYHCYAELNEIKKPFEMIQWTHAWLVPNTYFI